MSNASRRTLYLVVTGAPLTRCASDLIPEARDRGWEPVVIASQDALKWLDRPAVERQAVMVLAGHARPISPSGSLCQPA